MLNILSIGTLLGSLIFAAGLWRLAAPLLRFLSAGKSAAIDPRADEPAAAIILCVRGADPTLPACVDGLLLQAYRDYVVHIIMDSFDDPGAIVVRQTIAERDETDVPIVLHYLQNPQPHRGLKVSAILQVLGTLEEHREVIAFADADTAPNRNWLRDLADPLRDNGIGATCGTRWYHPQEANLGSLVRMNWNLFAVGLMLRHSITWGGAMAIHRRAFDQTNLLERWQNTLCEDACLCDVLASAGLRVEYVPTVAMANSEDADVLSVWRFVRRQFVLLRLDSTVWSAIAATTLAMTVFPLFVIGLLVSSCIAGNGPAIAVSSVAMLFVSLGVAAYEIPVRRRVLRISGANRKWKLSLRTLIATRVSILLSTLITAAAVVQACTTRVVRWRGVTYRIAGDSDIRMEQYQPMPSTLTLAENLSV